MTGASRGIGREVARALAGRGADLVLTSTRLEGTSALAAELEARGRRVLCFAGDVASAQDADRLVSEIDRVFGRVDVLVNNAGVVVRKPLAEMRDEDFTRVLEVNLTGPFLLCRRLVPGMVARGSGRIVNVSSISSTLGSPNMSGYCASKWGLNGLTRALAEELKGSGVTVVAVLPGSVDTDMLEGSGFAPAMGPEAVAALIAWYCAEAPDAVSGSLVEMFG